MLDLLSAWNRESEAFEYALRARRLFPDDAVIEKKLESLVAFGHIVTRRLLDAAIGGAVIFPVVSGLALFWYRDRIGAPVATLLFLWLALSITVPWFFYGLFLAALNNLPQTTKHRRVSWQKRGESLFIPLIPAAVLAAALMAAALHSWAVVSLALAAVMFWDLAIRASTWQRWSLFLGVGVTIYAAVPLALVIDWPSMWVLSTFVAIGALAIAGPNWIWDFWFSSEH